MESRHRILLLDDDPEVLELYREILGQLPSHPEVHTATTGARALALLDAEPFRLLISDLKMPKMDGLQVLSIVRRRFPELRTVVLTGVQDEEFRSRAYALGVDLFWLKPETQQNLQMFLECLESLLGRDTGAGFRGVQSKSLMDIIQMECLSQTSSVLRITHGSLIGRIWLAAGEVVHAEAEGAQGEAAFRRILEWRSGTFESLPAETECAPTINKPTHALLLEMAQAMDEVSNPDSAPVIHDLPQRKPDAKVSALGREGAEWLVKVAGAGAPEGWGTQAANEAGTWIRRAEECCKRLGERLDLGQLSHLDARGLDRRLVLLPWDRKTYLVAWPLNTEGSRALEQTKHLAGSWDS